jgi:hypothetical protein
MDDYKDVSKIAFVHKYGSDAHKAKAEDKISGIISRGDRHAVSHLATEDIPLTDAHMHGMIDQPSTDSHHPARMLAQSHRADLKDEHWNKMAVHPNKEVYMSALASAPLRHVKTMATSHPDPDIRQMATNQYVNKKRAGYPE